MCRKLNEMQSKETGDSGVRAISFAFTPGGLGIDKLNTFLKNTDPRFILEKLQSASDGMIYITIFYQL